MLTPMMRQYSEIKSKSPDSILFFRLGDFYEMFGDDARIASKELDIVLTTRDKSTVNPEEKMPMCGVPYHSAQTYIARLITKGYKVAICEQMSDPAESKGIVDRDIVRIISPGTLMDSSMLDEAKSNFLCSLYADLVGGFVTICFADLSTGEMSYSQVSADNLSRIKNELSTFSPAEAIIGVSSEVTGLHNDLEKTRQKADTNKDSLGKTAQSANKNKSDNVVLKIENHLVSELSSTVTYDNHRFSLSNTDLLDRHFGQDQCKALSEEAQLAVGALLSYLSDTQKTDISHLNTLQSNDESAYMELDISTMRNLELVASLSTGERRGSLLWVLDKAKTPMGRRLVRSWILRPLLSPSQISHRLSAVSALVDNTPLRGELISLLKRIFDIERLVGKIVFGSAGSRDLTALSASISELPVIVSLLSDALGASDREAKSAVSSRILADISNMDTLCDVSTQIDNMICDEPPFSIREGGFIRTGANPEVDSLRSLLEGKEDALIAIETRERERTGKRLKIGFNRVFGHYIEVPRSASDDMPSDYIRKQTLANCERFITQELKNLETELLSAKDSLCALEFRLFSELCKGIAEQVTRIQDTAKAVATLDVLLSFAVTAVQMDYCLPEVNMSGVVDIKDGRHPVVEVMQEGSLFVPNDTFLDSDRCRTAIITGPNMAGKSTYMRQTALIILMAQIGSFVPAKSACIGVVDRVFTRIGACDDLAAGKSTFMVEMTEVADILSHATSSSLLILDEIGRGTSTYDGMSIARAVLEYCTEKKTLGAKTMFATHYHELTILESEIDGIKNYNISAKKRGDDIIFLRKIVPGGADDSYGIEVAGLAGVPQKVIRRAKSVLAMLESGDRATPDNDNCDNMKDDSDSRGLFVRTDEHEHLKDTAYAQRQISLSDMSTSEVVQKLKDIDPNTLSPIEALSLLFELKKKL